MLSSPLNIVSKLYSKSSSILRSFKEKFTFDEVFKVKVGLRSVDSNSLPSSWLSLTLHTNPQNTTSKNLLPACSLRDPVAEAGLLCLVEAGIHGCCIRLQELSDS